MQEYEFFYGFQSVVFERPSVPAIVAKRGIKANILDKKYSISKVPDKKYSTKVKIIKYKVVVLNVCD